MGEDGRPTFNVPGDRVSRIGFFMGYAGPLSINGLVRIGDWPGNALVTLSDPSEEKPHEIKTGMLGIKEGEPRERVWAEQVRLYHHLGFAPDRSRGVFFRAHVLLEKELVRRRPLVAVPQGVKTNGLVRASDGDNPADLIQFLGYDEVLPPKPSQQKFNSFGTVDLSYVKVYEEAPADLDTADTGRFQNAVELRVAAK